MRRAGPCWKGMGINICLKGTLVVTDYMVLKQWVMDTFEKSLVMNAVGHLHWLDYLKSLADDPKIWLQFSCSNNFNSLTTRSYSAQIAVSISLSLFFWPLLFMVQFWSLEICWWVGRESTYLLLPRMESMFIWIFQEGFHQYEYKPIGD